MMLPACAQEQSGVEVIDIHTIQKEVIGKDVQFVDIRTVREYKNGYIDDAINIPIADKEAFIKGFTSLQKDKPVYIYCYSGIRSHRAGKILSELGFTEIYDFKGGWKAWSTKE